MKLTIDKKLCESIVETRDTHLHTSISVCLVVILHVFAGSFWKKKKKIIPPSYFSYTETVRDANGLDPDRNHGGSIPKTDSGSESGSETEPMSYLRIQHQLKKKMDNMFVSTDTVR